MQFEKERNCVVLSHHFAGVVVVVKLRGCSQSNLTYAEHLQIYIPEIAAAPQVKFDPFWCRKVASVNHTF